MPREKVDNKGKGKKQESSIKDVKIAPVLKVCEIFSYPDKKKKKDGT